MHDKKKVDSVIKNIVVYRDGAYVTRTVKINLSQGRNKIIIEKLPCSIKTESIQVGVADGISCQQVNYEPNHNQYRIDTDSDLKKTELMKELQEKKDELSILKHRLDMISKVSYRFDINADFSTLKTFHSLNNDQFTEIIKRQSVLRDEIEILSRKIHEENSVKDESLWKRLPGVIRLELTSEEDIVTEIEIQYFDSNSYWNPHYDIRLGSELDVMHFVLKGNIKQTTGEDWIEADVSVSTGKFGQRRYQGELKPWKLDGSSSSFRNGFNGVSCRYDENYDDYYANYEDDVMETKSIRIPEFLSKPKVSPLAGANRMATPVETKAFSPDTSDNEMVDNQNSTIYHLSERCTVLNGKGSDTIFISSEDVKCDISDYVTPKLDCTVFTVAKVMDYARYNFLECGANIFIENRLVGKTFIKPEGEDGTMLVSLGANDRVSVRRIIEKQYTSKVFIGTNQYQEHRYSIRIVNRKKSPINLNITDQVPVSDNSKITVDKIELSGGTMEETTGKVTWSLIIKPEEEKNIPFGFKITYPKGMNF